jgi:hypothetical protein
MKGKDPITNSADIFRDQTENQNNSAISRTFSPPSPAQNSKLEKESQNSIGPIDHPVQLHVEPGQMQNQRINEEASSSDVDRFQKNMSFSPPAHMDTTTSTNSAIRLLDCRKKTPKVLSYDDVTRVPGTEILVFDKEARKFKAIPKAKIERKLLSVAVMLNSVVLSQR